MRTRREIEDAAKERYEFEHLPIEIEVALDIRDLLNEIKLRLKTIEHDMPIFQQFK